MIDTDKRIRVVDAGSPFFGHGGMIVASENGYHDIYLDARPNTRLSGLPTITGFPPPFTTEQLENTK